MVFFRAVALTFLLGAVSCSGCEAFVSPAPSSFSIQAARRHDQCVSSTSALNAYAPPPMIIGPMIRKMREENAKKKMPMASEQERNLEAPGLRVGTGAWKWPPVWPYDGDMFKRKEEIQAAAAAAAAAQLTGGMGALPDGEVQDEKKLDVLKYWGEEKAEITTDLDDEASAQIKRHYSFYIRDGMAVLEIGAAENSYLPDNLKLSRHVGIGASKSLMEKNPSITESLVVDLNDVIEDVDVNSDDLRRLGANTFDAVVMANTIDFLTHPREVFRSAWHLLKPGGIMMVPFTSKDAYVDKFERAQTKMWRDMNDDQHMWICGSFFQFSAGEGWEGLKGFDISPEGANEDKGFLGNLMNVDKPMNVYVVQATKGYQADDIDDSDPEASFRSKMWMFPTMEERDKILVAPRLARAYNALGSEVDKRRLGDHVDSLPRVYESLTKMDQFAFTFSMQAQLASDLVGDPDFTGNDEQIDAMKMGLGLRTPSEDFWAPVGAETANMEPEDKVNLLAHIVPRFGSENAEQEESLNAFVSGLKPTFAVIRSKCPEMSEGDVQLVGTELLAAEVLKPGRSSREEFAVWLGAMNNTELQEILSKRKSFKENAVAEMKAFQAERKAEQDRIEEERKKMQEQVEKARKERTMVFNPKTGKMELVKEKK